MGSDGVTEVPTRVMPGLVTYKNELGFRVVVWHYNSDPSKRGNWADETAAGIVGGRASEHWRQEYEIDPFIVRGKPTYYGFAYHRNVVAALPCDISEFRQWYWFLSADFGSGGGATCWLFWAENPLTNDLLIFDEVYVDDSYGSSERTPEHIKPMVYERLRHWTGTPSGQPLDINRWVKYAVGDPSGLPFMQEYWKEPMRIPVGKGSPDAPVKLNDLPGGEERLNGYFSSSVLCCPSADNPEGRWYVNKLECPRCGQEKIGRPRLTILKSGAPHLIAQIPTIRKKIPRKGSEVAAEGNVRVEDHAEAAARYGAMSRPVVKADLTRRREETPSHELVVSGRFWKSLQNRLESERIASLYDDPEERNLALTASREYDERDGESGTPSGTPGGPW